MNNEYQDGDGFNFYRPADNPAVWASRNELQVDTFVRGRANRAVVFKTQGVLHGMEVRSNDFREDYRCTAGIFLF